MFRSSRLQILLIRRPPGTGRDRLRLPPGGCDDDDDDDDAMSLVAETIVGMLPRQIGQEFCSDSHLTMQWEWYRWPQGSRSAGADGGRGSVQTTQSSPASVTATVGRAAMDSGGAACDPPRWRGVSNSNTLSLAAIDAAAACGPPRWTWSGTSSMAW